VFKRWMKVVLVSDLPPAGPSSAPITCSKRQSIAPPFGQLASVPAVMKFFFCAQTRLLSKELCHVTSPKRGGFRSDKVGIYDGAEEVGMICTASPKICVKSVASGRALFTVQETPVLVRRQT